jgi:RNA polymerase sigma-70 factor (ECF subfamily)
MQLIPGIKRTGQKPDEELLKKFTQTGDLQVLGELYSGYMHLVYGVCLKYLKDKEESKDAVMQIFEKLIIEIPKHKIDNFRSWLHAVTKNYCLMQLRSNKSHIVKLEEWINESISFMESSTVLHPIDEITIDIEYTLEQCIGRLKDEQRECIRQFYYDNRCYLEIADNLGIDEKKVKSHLQNAKRNLKLCLEEKHAEKE